jgi:carbon storage regulator
MLVLSRKPGEVINIGDDISIMIVRIGPNTVRIGITAPGGVSIWRDELLPPDESRAERPLVDKGKD